MTEIPSYIRFVQDSKEKIGMSIGKKLFSLPYKSMQECIAADFNSKDKEEIEYKEIKIKAPIIPGKIVCLGWNYMKHTKELKHQYEKPLIFFKPSSSVIGHNEKIVIPKISKQVDHEVELGVVIGKDAKNIKKENSSRYIAGYTIILDITARDLQWEARNKGNPWSICKGFDTFSPIGPGIVPKVYIPEPNNLDIQLKVNNEIRQKSNTKHMIKSVEEIIEYISGFMTLQQGDIIATGTPEGVGSIKNKDIIESKIEKIGILKNYVVNEKV